MPLTPSANPRIVEALYEQALALADRARAEFQLLRLQPANDGGSHPGSEDLMRVQASCEALRTTTRIMHCLAWLLNHRAWFAGELTALQLRRHGRLIAHFPASDPASVAHLPGAAQDVVRESERLYQRIHRLEQAWQEPAGLAASPDPLPLALARLRERLGLALASSSLPDRSTWNTGAAQQLEPLVRRVLAPNPSPYTFTGTQTYLVGAGRDVAVIDPGPDGTGVAGHADTNGEGHVAAILAAVGTARVAAIVCTHTHRDHSPASRPLAALTGAPIIGCAPLAIEDNGPRADAAFDPDYAPARILADGEELHGDGWTLQAVATPGHTSNHLCLSLKQSGALFTGDHVMGWSTSVVSPPDGDMAAYMASLQKLYDRPQDRIYYPAHGDPIPNPHQFVRGMLGHRRQRERQILRVLESGTHDIPAMVAQMYKGLDPRLTGAAGRSVLAHLLDLERQGRVVRSGEQWTIPS